MCIKVRNKSTTRDQIKIVTTVTSRAEQKDPRTNDFYLLFFHKNSKQTRSHRKKGLQYQKLTHTKKYKKITLRRMMMRARRENSNTRSKKRLGTHFRSLGKKIKTNVSVRTQSKS